MKRPHAASLLVALALTVLATPAFAQGAPTTGAAPDGATLVATPPVPDFVAPTDPVAPAELTTPAEPTVPTPPDQQAAPAAAEPGSPVGARYVVGEGLTMRSADSLYSLTIRGYVQLRATLVDSVQDDVAASTEFQIRRLRLTLAGQFIVPELTYNVQFAFANRDQEPDLAVPVHEAWINYAPLRDVVLRVGQGKVPYSRQNMLSSGGQQFVDLSLVTSELGLDYDTGIYAYSKNLFGLGDRVQYQLGMFGGDGRNRLSNRSGLMWTGRIEVSPFGKFESYVESDQARTEGPHLQLAFGGALNKSTVRARSTTGPSYTIGGIDYQHLEADLIFKWAGLSLQAEVLWRDSPDVRSQSTVRMDGTTLTEYARPAWGYFVQGGYYLPTGLEFAARYGDLHPRQRSDDPTLVRARELGGAASWYFQRHALKVQADYFYLFGDTLDGGRHQVRVQAQLQF